MARKKRKRVEIPHWMREPTQDEIAEQHRIQAEILAGKIAAGPVDPCGTWVKEDKVYSVKMMPGGYGVLRGQG